MLHQWTPSAKPIFASADFLFQQGEPDSKAREVLKCVQYYTQTHRGKINNHRLNLMEVSLGVSNRTWEGYGNGVT